jgi:hypothetical protein
MRDETSTGELMKRVCLAALTGALAIATVAVTIEDASAAYRGGIHRAGVGRVGVGGVGRVGVGGVGRVGVGYGRAGIGYGRAVAYRGWGGNGYYRPGLGLAAGAALGTAAYYGSAGFYGDSGYGYGAYASGAYDTSAGDSGYGAFASGAYDASGADVYLLHGSYISESDALAYCAQQFRSYDVNSRTFLSYSGQRVSCPN